jgi:hypothetical protein
MSRFSFHWRAGLGRLLLASLCTAGLSGPATAGVLAPAGSWPQQKITADDAAMGDTFGYAVAVDGNVAVVGAPDGGNAGNGQGAVYVFVRSDGIWQQTQKLLAGDGASDDGFGFSVSVSGDSILIGAPYATVGGNGGQGAAYLFSANQGQWQEAGKLVADDGGVSNNFGWSVAIDGSSAVVSAPVAPVGDNALQGKAYIFSGSGADWSQTQVLTADDGVAFGTFGSSVAIDNGTAVIGSSGVDSYFGAAYVFEDAGGTWTQAAKLVPDDGTTAEFFGISVGVSGDTALVGAYYQNVGGNAGQGSAYLFSRDDTGTWAQLQKLTADDGAAGARFGLAVAMDGNRALVGSYFATIGANAHQGAAYVFSMDAGGTWNQTTRLTAVDGSADDNFGNAVAVSGGTALVAAFNADGDGAEDAGAAYLLADPAADTVFADGFDGTP